MRSQVPVDVATLELARGRRNGGLPAIGRAVLGTRVAAQVMAVCTSLAACGLSFDIPLDDNRPADSDRPTADAAAATAPGPEAGFVGGGDTGATADCHDGMRNGSEADIDCGGTCGTRCSPGAKCATTNDCADENICRSGTCAAAESCKALHEARPSLESGSYQVGEARDGGEPRSGCEMSFQGGGWTLALKADGAKDTFAYNSALWTTETLLNPTEVDLSDKTEAKLAAYHLVPFSAVALVFESGTERKQMVLPVAASSLGALVAAGATSMRGRSAWLALVPGSSLQTNCNAEGVSLTRGGAKVRIGIIGNNEPNCENPDSFLGVGGAPLCSRPTIIGNVACHNDGAGDRDLPVFARVLVR